MEKEIKSKTICYHCGESCDDEIIHIEHKYFCCQGCKTVYEILNKVELCNYYSIEAHPGQKQKTQMRNDKFAFLDDEQIQLKLIHFKDAHQSHVTFYLPQMHCSSCIWLLENLTKLDKNIVRSQVNFLKKEVSVVFDHKNTSIRKVAEILTLIGYEPHLSLNDISEKKIRKYDKSRIYKIGIVGFCFGNIMLLSFPEYFSLGKVEEKGLKLLFSYLILFLSLPVFFYGASEFFTSAWKSIRQKFLNIDAPIALAILITFGRSVYEIVTDTGAGYLDSMTGIVFFMLLGRFFQNKTYNTLSFNRDYTSYFPLSVSLILESGEEKQIPVSELKTGQRIKIRSEEIIPADCILFFGKAKIDYSFVSGESLPIEKNIGEIIYAGGKQLGGAIEMEVVKDVSQSYLTQLWNNDAFQKNEEKSTSFIHSTSKYFTIVLFSIALLTGIYWYLNDVSHFWNSITSILIVACPCALLLSSTFTNGNMLRVLQKFGFYARNANVIEQVALSDAIVFDKTGTITRQERSTFIYEGVKLSFEQEQIVRSLASQSSHPFSKAVMQALPASKILAVKAFKVRPGFGIEGDVLGNQVIIGSAVYVEEEKRIDQENGSKVYIKINGDVLGSFTIKAKYRNGLTTVFRSLKKRYQLSLLSGDNDAEQNNLKDNFNSGLLFDQSPQQKLEYIRNLQDKGRKVIMVGDGLNDAGALQQSNVGIAITDNVNNFSPACDVIMSGKSFSYFDLLLSYCKYNKVIINLSFIISILYNIVGLYFAVQDRLQPVIAAILMPVSSVTIVLFTTGMSSLLAYKLKKFGSKTTNENNN
ncbi:MAG: heavy metal translocating P-type ATPase metal-binding domain-containing protein [Bacteroidia bacterium]|nr:heavy metal translocating P-type ATPase metal-binding domain-containing protein [Bacteroidia bacterium]